MTKKRKSWQEKLADDKDLPKLVTCEEGNKLCTRLGLKPGDILVVPAPREVDEIMRLVPEGKLTTINEIREALAERHNTAAACPITTGIFARIAAEASVERGTEGKGDITPYWRTLKAGGVINEKYPGGPDGQKRLLEKEGHRVIQRGKRYVVEDYEKFLMKYRL